MLSAGLFDPFPSIDDLFAGDPALAVQPSLPAHASGDLSIQFSHADTTVATASLSHNPPAADNLSQRIGGAPTNQAPVVDPQFLAALQANTPARVLPSISPQPQISRARTDVSPLILPSVRLTGPANVPVNADNDNGSNIVTTTSGGLTGIPTKRDFNVQPLANADPDILQASLAANGLPAGGTWTENLTQNGVGQIKLWTDAKKTAAFTIPAGLTATFYIEGFHESTAANDITLSFTYRVNGVGYNSDVLSITVTPLITAFTVTPGADAGDPNNQNITFKNGTNGNLGLQALTPNGAYGASYKAVAIQSGLSGQFKFIQNIKDVVNGNNGTTDDNGTAVGWLHPNKSGEVIQLKNGGFPVLDILASDPDQTYQWVFKSVVSPDGTTVTITDADVPGTGYVTASNYGVKVDVLIKLRTYIVWQWNQVASNSGGVAVPVFYFLAYNKWQANFYAHTVPMSGPITVIDILDGVTADNNYTVTNTDPGPNALDMKRIWSGNAVWMAAT